MTATRQRRFTLTAAVLVTVMTVLDFNVVSVAMPDILDSFPGSTLPQASWILNGYSVVFAAALLPSGTLADRWGTPRLFTLGVLVFAGGSLLCALAPGLWWLVLARGVQAVGGGALITTNIAMGLAALPDRRGTVYALFGAAAGVTAAAGPSLGGALVALGGWHLIFLVNLPVSVIVVVCGRLGVAPDQDPTADRRLPDVAGILLLAACVGLTGLFLVQGGGWGWASVPTGAAIAGSVLFGAVGAVRALRHPRPAVDLTLLRARPTAVGNAALVMVSIVQYSAVLCLTLLLSEVWHYPPSRVGLALTPGPIATALVSWAGGRWVQRFGPRPVVAVGAGVAIAASLWFGLVVGPDPAYLTTLLPMLVLGFGGVWLAGMGLNTLAVSAVPPRRFGTAGALTMLSRTLGATIGIASLAVVLAVPSVPGFRLVWWSVAGCLAVIVALMGLLRPQPREVALPAAVP